ncbi:acetyl-CoA acetyltransferase [Actinomarinicola tropica]|uniref:Thiolase n=1 Tax=Actinomarinicola tropica TaxID=2789776 RepID=A0A5Q2RQQ0_9ACTN|nr:acetyl-CoA acetyltransferase [Actinomarinicola tropica]QGG96220.1 thiolase [Actinomarinicola tropica]
MTERTLRGAAAIVGVADAASPTGVLDRHGRALEAAMISAALADAGLTLADVDGVTCANGPAQLAEHLGIHPRYLDGTNVGGSSYELHVEHAAAAIAAGLCEVVIGVYAATPRGDRQRAADAAAAGGGRGRRGGGPGMMGGPNPGLEWEMPYGLRTPMGAYALAASRHMYEYGTTSEQLAQIAVDTRRWASMNPNARFQDPITIDDVLASPLQASPLHLLDCCLVTDGAGAFVMTTPERAASLAKPPVLVLGAATCGDHSMISQMPDLTTTAGAVSGPAAFAMAGVKPDDVDLLMGYDSFTITALLHLEDLGFCGKGEGGAFVEDGKLGPGGSLPMNTNGGGLSYTHPGMYGMFLIVEAVRQLRGESGERQLDGPEIAVAHGSGGLLSTMGTLVLGTEATL